MILCFSREGYTAYRCRGAACVVSCLVGLLFEIRSRLLLLPRKYSALHEILLVPFRLSCSSLSFWPFYFFSHYLLGRSKFRTVSCFLDAPFDCWMVLFSRRKRFFAKNKLEQESFLAYCQTNDMHEEKSTKMWKCISNEFEFMFE